MATENKNLSQYDKNTIPNAKDFRFGIVVSEWNENVTEGLYNGVTQGMKDLNLLYDVPTIFCVLTDNTMQQSIDRSGGKHGNKGIEAAIAAIKMIDLNKKY
jgi:6,7-dimethyl-8-ribityllumazine synthase